MVREGRLIPDPVRAEVKVEVQLPPELRSLVNDLHNDRQAVGIGSVVIVGCTVLMTLRSFFGKKE